MTKAARDARTGGRGKPTAELAMLERAVALLRKEHKGSAAASLEAGCFSDVTEVLPTGIDVLDRHELRDLDRARVVVSFQALQLGVLDDDVLAFRLFPAFDDLVRADLAVVLRAPTLLLDGRQALAMQQTE